MEEQKIILKDLFCTLCSLQFDKKYVFDVHLSIVHGQKIKVKTEPDICETNKTEVSGKNCSSNVFEKYFGCEICNHHFTRKYQLKKHTESVHEEKKPFKCEICNYSFSQKIHLKTHLKSVHEKKEPI